ncbi:serine protease inhibitor A3B-like [Mus pahari]|uniref:serine protease inhibitor A3B-like n=1 Tax=Mus pahari TaxID=10093 RepID=UPI000A30B446|nr:serine protease inhibitor A3B-like [Mus pahari]
MAFSAALVLLLSGVCPAVMCFSGGTLGRHTAVQKGQDAQKQWHSLTVTSLNTDIAFFLYKKMALKIPHKNIVFSPFAIANSLGSLSLGAKGKTLQEILEVLKFNRTGTPEADIHQGFGHLFQSLSQPGDQIQMSTGNALFVEKHLKILTEFKEKARALYQAEAFTADFQQPCEATKLINDYVRKQTQGKIKELVSDLDEKTFMVMVNDIIFTGKWRVPFDPKDTFMGKFILDSSRPVKVPMMKMENISTPYFRDEELKCTVIELNYTNNVKAMFILPDQGKMQEVEASLQTETLRKWRKSLRHRMIDELHLPKFFLSQHYNLGKLLSELGIRELFSTQADLSGITGAKKIIIASEIVHTAILNMTEPGTEADADTMFKYDFLSAKIKPTIVSFEGKFLYILIVPSSEFILFMGKVINPLEN